MDMVFCIFIGLACLMLATGQGITPGALNTNVTNSGCGTVRACFTDPAGCNPETNKNCLFVSTQSRGNLNFQLRGESEGYIAMVLSTDTTAGNNDTTYICTRTPKFFLAILNNGNLTIQNTTTVTNVNASLGNTTTIQCMFDVSGLNASASRNSATTFSIALASGTLGSDGSFSSPALRSIIPSVNLADPSSTNTPTTTVAPNTTNAANATTATTARTAATTRPTSGANISLQHGFSQALLIVLGVLGMSLL